jgi:hypothetical protein
MQASGVTVNAGQPVEAVARAQASTLVVVAPEPFATNMSMQASFWRATHVTASP